jgi:hypothetical protein
LLMFTNFRREPSFGEHVDGLKFIKGAVASAPSTT